MKKLLKTVGLVAFAATSLSAQAQESTDMNLKASYIEMQAAAGQADSLSQFLADAAPIVKETEPGTEQWFAMQAGEQLAIFDTFTDEEARSAHFAGAVAEGLKQSSDELVEGGWHHGVIPNIDNSSVLSAIAPVDIYDATTATYIKLKAAPGKGDALAELLTAAGPIVAETEPKTLYWVSLRLDESDFAIFDIFADESGREAHFAGQVATLLKEKSAELVKGGWEEGVVANVNNYSILAIK